MFLRRSILLALFALAGCQELQQARGPQLEQIGQTCRAYGFKPETDAFTQCVFQLDQTRIANNRAAIQSITDDAQARSNAWMQRTAVNRPKMCNSTPVAGGGFMTSCY